MDGSAFCDKNVQISSLCCSFTVFYSFLGQLLTSFITNKKHNVLLCKVGQRLLCAYCVLYNVIDWLLQLL